MENGITKYRMYMTKKHQNWTMGEKDALLPYLDGEDDEILEYAIINKDFAIILKNSLLFHLRNYSICEALACRGIKYDARRSLNGIISAKI